MANAQPSDTSGLMSLVAPDLQAQQVALQRQQQMVDLLKQQALTPIESQTVTGAGPARVVPISPIQGIVKLLQSYMGGQDQQDLDTKNLALQQQYRGAMADLLRGNQPTVTQTPDQTIFAQPQTGQLGSGMQGIVDTPSVGQPVTDLSNSSGPMIQQRMNVIPDNVTIPGQSIVNRPSNNDPVSNALRTAMASSISPQYGEVFAKQFDQSPTDLQKMMSALNINSNSQTGQQILGQQIAKINNIPLEQMRAGSYGIDPITKKIMQFPVVAPGAQAISDGNGGFRIAPVPGGNAAEASSSVAKASGPANFEMKQVFDPVSKAMVYVSAANLAGNPTGASQTSLNQSNSSPSQQGYIGQNLLNQLPPQVMAGILKDAQSGDGKFDLNYQLPSGQRISGPVDLNSGNITTNNNQPINNKSSNPMVNALMASPPLGTATTIDTNAVNAANGLNTKWIAQQADSKNAETNNSYLRQISSLSSKADTGRFEDQMNLWNSVLAPYNVKASNAAEAHSLIDKYQSQIIQQLGGGEKSTDALRGIQSAGTPGNEMYKTAIPEAVNNLIGQNDMKIARTNLLQNDANSRDPISYTNKEIIFDKNANPMLWQYKNMQPGSTEAKAFLQKAIKIDPNFLSKARTLNAIGAY